MTVSGNMHVQIEGGSPWGFRLQGGGGFPLQVLKVRKRSKTYRHLIEGDIIIKVNGIQVQGKSHEAVMDMVDATVGALLHLEIYRGEALHKIPKKSPGSAPLATVAPASQASSRSSSVQSSEHSTHQQTTEESMYQKRMSSQQFSSQQMSQQQQVTKSNLVLQNKAQQQQKVTQRQHSSQWQESSSQQEITQQQQQMSAQQQQNALQHQQMLADQKTMAEQQLAEQQMVRNQLAQARQMANQQQQVESEQQSMQQSMSSVEQTESHEEQTTSVSTAMWTSNQTTNEIQSELVHHAVTSSPKPFKPKVAGHLPLRDAPFTPVRPSPPAPSPIPPAYDKENVAPSPVPKPQTPTPNYPLFNVKNVKNIVNQGWNEIELDVLDLPIPDYTQKMTIPPRPPKEDSPPVMKKTIEIPDMTFKPSPPVAPKPKRVFAEVQPVEAEPWIPDSEIIPIKPEDRPHLPIFGPPVVYGLNPALAPQTTGEEESMVSETSSGSRKNDPNYETKKQKIYSDSSFYYDPSGVYPTIEDQMDLCKKISQSLTAAANSRARGATMFAKRQKRSTKWIHAGFSDGMVADLEELCSELDQTDGGTKPLFQFRIPRLASQVSLDNPPTMSLTREEYETMMASQKVDHKVLNPNAMSIISDLQNSKGRGAKLFAKRQARCEKWVVDDKTSVSAPVTPSEPPPPPIGTISSTEMMNVQNRLAGMIQQPMPIIQPAAPPATAPKPAPKPAPKAPLPDPPIVKKNIGIPLPTVNADLKAEFKTAFDGPNFNRKARGWKSGPSEPPSSDV